MAACRSLQHIFDKPLDHPPPLFNPIEPLNGCFNLREKPDSILSSLASSVTRELSLLSPDQTRDHHQRSVSLSSANSDSLSEALGFESFDDIEDFGDQWEQRHECKQSLATTTKHAKSEILSGDLRRSRISRKEIPPPISSIGRRVCFESYRSNGRLVLKEVKIPTQELLHACREDGRLKQDCGVTANNAEKNETREESP